MQYAFSHRCQIEMPIKTVAEGTQAPAVRKVVACAFDHAGAQGDDQCGVTARLSELTSGNG